MSEKIDYQKIIKIAIEIVEFVITVILFLGVVFSLVKIPEYLTGILEDGAEVLEQMVSYIAIIIIATEFVKVLSIHKMEDVIIILVVAFVREMVIREWSLLQLMFGVICIAGLFAVKYFIVERKK